mmetsp:Transcript_105977/g.299615  ORF Transcript_105977/g.299615 Transcript_105977/m.299615 type:complete len:319 (-) Transcript_105977:408-1364(-)
MKATALAYFSSGSRNFKKYATRKTCDHSDTRLPGAIVTETRPRMAPRIVPNTRMLPLSKEAPCMGVRQRLTVAMVQNPGAFQAGNICGTASARPAAMQIPMLIRIAWRPVFLKAAAQTLRPAKGAQSQEQKPHRPPSIWHPPLLSALKSSQTSVMASATDAADSATEQTAMKSEETWMVAIKLLIWPSASQVARRTNVVSSSLPACAARISSRPDRNACSNSDSGIKLPESSLSRSTKPALKNSSQTALKLLSAVRQSWAAKVQSSASECPEPNTVVSPGTAWTGRAPAKLAATDPAARNAREATTIRSILASPILPL